MENISQIKKIEAFLQNTMSQEELAAFKQEMANDPGLAKMVEEFRHTFQALQSQWLSKSVTAAAKSIHLLHVLKVALISVVGVGMASLIAFYSINNKPKATIEPTAINSKDTIQTNITLPKTDTSISIAQVISEPPAPTQINNFHESQEVSINSFISIEEQYKTFRESLQSDTQYFMVNNKYDTVIIGNSGVSIEIPANSIWSFQEQKCVEKEVEIKLIEFTNYFQLYQARVSTMCNDKLLNSGGSCYLEVVTKGDSMIVAPDKQITLSFPCNSIDTTMNTYYGNKNKEGTVVWTGANENGDMIDIAKKFNYTTNTTITYDTLYFVKTFKNTSSITGRDLYSHLYSAGYRKTSQTFFSDTRSHQKWGNYVLIPVRFYKPASKISRVMGNLIYSNRFGFINCDQFLREAQLENITLQSSDSIVDAYMFFKYSNSCMPAFSNKFHHIPHNYEVLIVAILSRNGKLYMSFTETKTHAEINLNKGILLNTSVIEEKIKAFSKNK